MRKLLRTIPLAGRFPAPTAASTNTSCSRWKIRPFVTSAVPPTIALRPLDERLAAGKVPLKHHRDLGYLQSILKALDVPESSQVLVFSKTSFQAPRIGPHMPRAIYHSDDVTVGFVRGGDVLEIAVVDATQGVLFYTFDQMESTNPRFVRRAECTQCHVGASTLGVPGLVVRSVHADRTGQALLEAPSYVTDHRSPLDRRWGGWYVSGMHGDQRHMGNKTVTSREDPELDMSAGLNLSDLHRYIDPDAYLQPSSDIVSLMVLEHQTRMTNLITRLGWETRLSVEASRLEATVDELVKYMLFRDETRLTSPIKGSEAFAAEFTAKGPRDSKGRSLARLRSEHSHVPIPLVSYLIYSAQFDGLPASAKERVYRRLYDGLDQHDETQKAIVEILRETKKDLPAYWK